MTINSLWKKFDYRCYSILTDNLNEPFIKEIPNTLKCDNIVSFKSYKSLGGLKNGYNINNNDNLTEYGILDTVFTHHFEDIIPLSSGFYCCW